METHAQYSVPGVIGRNDLACRPCCKVFDDPAYVPPTPEEVDGLIKLAGWSQSDVAKLVGVGFNPKKGSTTVRKWRSPVVSVEHRDIPYSAWRLLLLYAGIVELRS